MKQKNERMNCKERKRISNENRKEKHKNTQKRNCGFRHLWFSLHFFLSFARSFILLESAFCTSLKKEHQQQQEQEHPNELIYNGFNTMYDLTKNLR